MRLPEYDRPPVLSLAAASEACARRTGRARLSELLVDARIEIAHRARAGARVLLVVHALKAIRVHNHAARANRTPHSRKDMSHT